MYNCYLFSINITNNMIYSIDVPIALLFFYSKIVQCSGCHFNKYYLHTKVNILGFNNIVYKYDI